MLTCSHQQTPISNTVTIQNNRLYQWYNLLFFVLVLLSGCRNNRPDGITIIWDEQKAKAVHIPSKLVPEQNLDSVKSLTSIRLTGNSTDIFGNLYADDGIVFEPLLPFTPGSSYEVFYRGKLAGTFSIPRNNASAPVLQSAYPGKDTVPVNILKIYLQFSQPMRESVSSQYIRLLKNGTDTLPDVFLDLQPELWNEDRTVLTIWFDPGRIKRDLQPNQKMGAPLEEGVGYKLLVDSHWQNAQGKPMEKKFTASFVAGTRDSLSPDPARWTVQSPKAGSSDPLIIDVQESLDHFLLLETVQVVTKQGNIIKGRFITEKNDSQLHFIPASNWQAGAYQLFIDAKLEDLAGNNLNKPFDRDVTKTKAADIAVYKKDFVIR